MGMGRRSPPGQVNRMGLDWDGLGRIGGDGMSMEGACGKSFWQLHVPVQESPDDGHKRTTDTKPMSNSLCIHSTR